MQNYTRNCIILILSAAMMACAPRSSEQSGDTSSLAGLQSMGSTQSAQRAKNTQMGKIREMALRETALSLGAQSGLAWRAKFIDEQLVKETRNLDAVFDFNSLLLDHNILPPVLLEGRNSLNLADTQTIRISNRTYKVAKQARFVTTAPNWRQFLWMDYKQPEKPNVTLLPKNDSERAVWKQCVETGWKNGTVQANIILEENIARIKEDFNGMILYRKLLAMNMISPPFVSHTDLGITGDASELHIDDQVLRITALPALNTNSKEWHAAVSKDQDSLAHFRQMEKMVESAEIKVTSKTWQPLITPVH